jgi:hypothetical protein
MTTMGTSRRRSLFGLLRIQCPISYALGILPRALRRDGLHEFEAAVSDRENDGRLVGVALGVERDLPGDAVMVFGCCNGVAELLRFRSSRALDRSARIFAPS